MNFKSEFKIALVLSSFLIVPVPLKVSGQDLDHTIVHKDTPTEKSPSEPQAQEKSIVWLLQSDERECVVEILTPYFQSDKKVLGGTIFDVLHVPGYGLTDVVSHPQLPLKGFLVGLPPEGEIELKIVDSEFSTRLGYFVSPVPKAKVIEEDPAELPRIEYEYSVDGQAYSSNSAYPGELAEVGWAGVIRGQRVAQVKVYPFQYNPAQNELKIYHRIVLEISFVGRTNFRDHSPVRDPFDMVLKNTILNYEIAQKWRAVGSSEGSFEGRDINPSFHGPQYKIGVEEDGVCKIDAVFLQEAGVNVVDIDPRTLKLYNKGEEIPIDVHGESDAIFNSSDYVEFYGQKMTGDFTKTNVYWLTWGGDHGLRMREHDGSIGTPRQPVQKAFRKTLRFENDERYWTSVPHGEDEDHWFWVMLNSSVPFDISFSLSTVNDTSAECSLRVMLYGYSESLVDPDHHISVFLNDQSVADIWWEGQTKRFTEVTFPQSYLRNGANTLRLVRPMDTGSTIDVSYLNWCEIEYWKSSVAEDSELLFSAAYEGGQRYEVPGFVSQEIHLFDITDPTGPVRIVNFGVEDQGQSHTLVFEDHLSGEREYVALTEERLKSPVSIVEDEFTNWRSSFHGADYIIITHKSFYERCQPLSERRRGQGWRSEVIDVEDLYDEFSYGLFNPVAISHFLTYAYYNWQPPPPTYILLVGDASYDYKDNLNLGKINYVPTHLFETDLTGQTGSDNWFVCVDGDDQLPDMCIGRLCPRSSSETESSIRKILQYEDFPEVNDWNSNALLVADNDWIFENYSDVLAEEYLPKNYHPHRVYLNSYAHIDDARADIVSQLNRGCTLTSFIGHGNMYYWSGDRMFGPNDVASLDNGNTLPLIVTVSCLNGYFLHAQHDYCLAEEFVRPEDRGAIACWSPTGLGYVSQNFHLEERLFESFFRSDIRELGLATTAAKILGAATYGHAEAFMDLVETYVLFGDPALELDLPVPKSPLNLVGRGGDGFVELRWGLNTESDLAGYNVYRSLDSLNGYERINPDLLSRQAYRDTSVSNGVKYSYAVTAVDAAENESHFSNSITVIPDIPTSVQGTPEIEIWVNGAIFEEGGTVSPHPTLRITFSDEGGLDCANAWIAIDGERETLPASEIHCAGRAGVMTEGWFEHRPSLSGGEHTLEIGVKGLSGRIAIKRTSFHVIAHLRIEQVLSYPNPMKNETAFVFQLSWPAEVTIKIYTAAGRLIRILHVSSHDSYNDKFRWDGRDEDGDRVANGLYLFKLIASDGVDRVETVQKLVVMR